MITRRKFISRSLLLAGSSIVAPYHSGSRAYGASHSAELSLYVVMWRFSEGASLLPWRAHAPRVLAESFMHLVWKYLQAVGPYENRSTKNRPHLVGHAAILAVLKTGNGETRRLIFSNTSNVEIGIYRHPALPKLDLSPLKFPLRPPYLANPEAPVLAAGRPVEMLLGHNANGVWESYRRFRRRIDRHSAPRVQKITITGLDAHDAFSTLEQVGGQTDGPPQWHRDRTLAAPRYYGLNADEIRLLTDFDNPRKVEARMIDGKPLLVPGGCGNAAAAILGFLGLAKHVPRERAGFEVTLSESGMKDAVFPITMQEDAFDQNRKLTTPSLIEELKLLPKSWGHGQTARFIDPNHWHDAMDDDPSALFDLRKEMGLTV